MNQPMNVILTIDNTHSTIEGPGLQSRLRWVKPGLWAQPPPLSATISLAYILTSVSDVLLGINFISY